MAEEAVVGAKIWLLTHSFLFLNILIDLQRASFGKQELRQAGTGWSSAKTAREGCHAGSERVRERASERAEERKKGKTWHGSVKSASFVCFLGLSFRKENRPGVQKNSELFGFQT